MSSDEISMSNALSIDLRNLLGQVILQRRSQLVVHVDLNRHQKELTHFKDRTYDPLCEAGKSLFLWILQDTRG